jgi:uncharacterized protein YdeI (YjbR/CyaY-like superfamily)
MKKLAKKKEKIILKVEPPTLLFATAKKWEEWLKKNFTQQEGLWLSIAKKESGIMSVTYLEALDVALCYGWIDGQKAKGDDKTCKQRFTPRRAKSIWSKVNCAKAEGLIQAGKMKPNGLLEIQKAKSDGRWDEAYASQSAMTLHEDFETALAKNKKAKTFYESLKKSDKYSFYFRVHQAKKSETRKKKIEEFVAMLGRGETIHGLLAKAKKKSLL